MPVPFDSTIGAPILENPGTVIYKGWYDNAIDIPIYGHLSVTLGALAANISGLPTRNASLSVTLGGLTVDLEGELAGYLLLEGDMTDGDDRLLLEGDMQSMDGDDAFYSEGVS